MVSKQVLGFALVVLGAQFAVLANTVVKLLAGVPMLQLMQARFLLQWICSFSLCLVLRWRGHPIHILGQPGRRLLLTTRACTFSGALGCIWCSVRTLPVGEATAINFLNPVVCGLLAMYFLGEKLGWRFSLQAAVSCCGVLLVVNPFGPEFHRASTSHANVDSAVLVAIAGCILFATANCAVRALKDVHPLEVQVFTDFITAFVLVPAAQVTSGAGMSWNAWDSHQIVLLLVFSSCGLLASLFVILGYTFAPASKASLFMYVEVPSAFAMQVCFFGEVPGAVKLGGATVIVAAAISRLWYEARLAGPEVDELPISSVPAPEVLSPALPTLPSPATSLLMAGAHLQSPGLEPLKLPFLDEDEPSTTSSHVNNVSTLA